MLPSCEVERAACGNDDRGAHEWSCDIGAGETEGLAHRETTEKVRRELGGPGSQQDDPPRAAGEPNQECHRDPGRDEEDSLET